MQIDIGSMILKCTYAFFSHSMTEMERRREVDALNLMPQYSFIIQQKHYIELKIGFI